MRCPGLAGAARPDPTARKFVTLRSIDPFNTTIHGYDDRFRGIKGTRRMVLMTGSDIERLGFIERQNVTLTSAAKDQIVRIVSGFRVHRYDIPPGCISGYPVCDLPDPALASC